MKTSGGDTLCMPGPVFCRGDQVALRTVERVDVYRYGLLESEWEGR